MRYIVVYFGPAAPFKYYAIVFVALGNLGEKDSFTPPPPTPKNKTSDLVHARLPTIAKVYK
jgi:hypothetical protein